MIDGTPFAGAANPVYEPAGHAWRRRRGSDPFTFNAIVGAWVRPVPACSSASRGRWCPTDIVTNGTLRGDAASTRRAGTRRRSRADGKPANDVSVDPAAAADGARRRALPRPGGRRARASSTSSWTSTTRPGRASTSSRSRPRPGRELPGADACASGDIDDRQALARHGGGEAGRRRRRDPGPAGAARRRVLRDGGRRRRLRQRRLRRRRRCSAAAVGGSFAVRALGGRARLPAPPPADGQRHRGRRRASTSRCRPAPACRPTPATTLQPELPRAAVARGQRRHATTPPSTTCRSPLLYRFGMSS